MFLSMLLVMLIVGGVDGTGVAKSLASSHVVGMLCLPAEWSIRRRSGRHGKMAPLPLDNPRCFPPGEHTVSLRERASAHLQDPRLRP